MFPCASYLALSSLYAPINEIPQYSLFGVYRRLLGDLTLGRLPGGGGFDTNKQDLSVNRHTYLTYEVAPVMGDLITLYVKSPCIHEQGVLGHYIDKHIMSTATRTWGITFVSS